MSFVDCGVGQPPAMDIPKSAGVPCPENEEAWWQEVAIDMFRETLRETQRNMVIFERASSPEHKQVLVESPWGPEEVDVGMVAILKALWTKQVRTTMSCENNNGNVWIDFELGEFKLCVKKAKRSSDLTQFLIWCLTEFRWDLDYDDFDHVSLRFPCRYKEAFEAFLAAW